MGVLRILLAYAVVISHSSPLYGFTGIGGNAVPAFFIISGFYIHLAISQKYLKIGGTKRFYANRFLRLMPMYWLALGIYIFIASYDPGYEGLWDKMYLQSSNAFNAAIYRGTASYISFLPNLTTVGADITRLFCISPITQHVIVDHASRHSDACSSLYHNLMMPQVWSLSVEIVCYAACPFAARLRTSYLLTLTAALIVIQRYAFVLDLAWSNLPFWYNAPFFFAGLVSYRLYIYFESFYLWKLNPLILAPFVIFAFYSDLAEFLSKISFWTIWGIYACSIPALYAATRNNLIDRRIGDLSYPIYLIHWLFAWPMSSYGMHATALAIVASTAAAGVMILMVEIPLRRVRRRIASGDRQSVPKIAL